MLLWRCWAERKAKPILPFLQPSLCIKTVMCLYIVRKLLTPSWFITEQRQIGDQAEEKLLLIWHNTHIHMHPSVRPSLVSVILVLIPSVSRSPLIERILRKFVAQIPNLESNSQNRCVVMPVKYIYSCRKINLIL